MSSACDDKEEDEETAADLMKRITADYILESRRRIGQLLQRLIQDTNQASS